MTVRACRDSGVEWLGQVPHDWSLVPLKRALRLITDRANEHTFPVALENLEGWTGRFLSTETTYEGEGIAFRKGDLLFGKLRPYLAKVWASDRDGEAVGDIHVLRPSGANISAFLQRFLLTREAISLIDGATQGAKMPRASWEFMGSLVIALPPPDEQSAIATFLERETGKIDALVAEQERLIALLKEKRQAVISHAVTKGLNPNAPMKNSGVAWLDEVPAHWNVATLSKQYDVQLGRMLNEERSQGRDLRPYLRVFDVQWGRINVENLPVMDFPLDARSRYRLQDGDLLVNEGGSYVGRSAIWRSEINECYYQKALHRLRPYSSEYNTAEYLYFVMDAFTRQGVFIAGANQTTIDHLTAQQLRQHRFVFPPLSEQIQIASYLQNASRQSDALVAEATHAITLLRERRAALISAAVTGKIDVRDTVPAMQNVA